MKKSQKLAAFAAVVLMVSASSLFADKRHEKTTDAWRNGGSGSRYATVEGRIRDIDRERNGFVIRLDRGEMVFAPVQTRVENASSGRRRTTVRDLERGDYVRASGVSGSRGLIHAERIAIVRSEDDRRDRDDRILSGIVQSVDRRDGIVIVRDERSRRTVAVDVSGVARRDRDELFELRRGARITVRGDWRRDGRFEAERIDTASGRW